MRALNMDNLLAPPLAEIDPSEDVVHAASRMWAVHSRHAPVVDGGTLIGQLVLRDLPAARGAAPEDPLLAGSVPQAADVMVRAYPVRPEDDLSHAARIAERRKQSCLPVVSGDTLVGVVLLESLLRAAVDALAEADCRLRVSDVMTPAPLAVIDVLASAEEADLLMRRLNIRHLPVLARGQLVGMLSDNDILATQHDERRPLSSVLVGEIMSSFPAVIGPAATLLEAGASLLDAHIGALPVLEGRTIAGLITKSDILRLASGGPPHGGATWH